MRVLYYGDVAYRIWHEAMGIGPVSSEVVRYVVLLPCTTIGIFMGFLVATTVTAHMTSFGKMVVPQFESGAMHSARVVTLSKVLSRSLVRW